MAVNKSGWNKNIKVSQSTINEIKKMGMSNALKLAKMNSSASQSGMVAEYQEATRRLYGEKRFAAATGKKSTITPPKKVTTPTKPGANKPAPKGTTKPTPGATTKPTPGASTKPGTKANTTSTTKKKNDGINFGNIAKVAGGTAAAIGIIAATKGRGLGAAARFSPAVARLATTPAGKALLGAGSKVGSKTSDIAGAAKIRTAAKTGQAIAKRGGEVTEAQYKAMVAAAKAKGIKSVSAEAAKNAAKTTAKKAPVKPPVKKIKATAGLGAGAGTVKTKPGKK